MARALEAAEAVAGDGTAAFDECSIGPTGLGSGADERWSGAQAPAAAAAIRAAQAVRRSTMPTSPGVGISTDATGAAGAFGRIRAR